MVDEMVGGLGVVAFAKKVSSFEALGRKSEASVKAGQRIFEKISAQLAKRRLFATWIFKVCVHACNAT